MSRRRRRASGSCAGRRSATSKTADSGNKRCHTFCGDCGGPVYASALEDPPTYSLRIGALDQRYDLGAPARQIYAERRLPWVCDLADVRSWT
jgi:hypothetical protein